MAVNCTFFSLLHYYFHLKALVMCDKMSVNNKVISKVPGAF